MPGGGLAESGRWKTARGRGRFLFPVKAMSRVFRAKYLHALRQRVAGLDRALLDSLFAREWVVYAKRPFAGPQGVVEYLGRYTHKVAISNHRIKQADGRTVTFSYRDYRKGAQTKLMTLPGMEFIRRFSLHILPRGFVRIRHYGILSSSGKKEAIPAVRAQLPKMRLRLREPRKAEPYSPRRCPCCNTQTMVTLEIYGRRGPPPPHQSFRHSHQQH